ncbi:MAG: hypothetical protein JW876_01650 [Candidatus Krumholzibacteriota bacterium]|nr:hypothetical protein [Candidatus Krumholzibacteriota bacterium]
MKAKTILAPFAFLALAFLFFGLALDNGFWQSADFLLLDQSLRIDADHSAVYESSPPRTFQPIVYGIHALLFKRFFFAPRGYLIFNIILHALNSYLVFLMVRKLLRDDGVAFLSALLFVFTVGSYGKTVMIASGFEDLLVTAFTLSTMYFFFKNEIDAGGRMFTPWFALAFVFFVASMLSKSTSFSILGAFLAFNFFFRKDAGTRTVNGPFVVLLLVAAAALVVKLSVFGYRPSFYTRNPGPWLYIYYAAKNVINYLVRMIFPIHTSNLVEQAALPVRFIYRFATEIRILISLTVVSYSVFGFIFGNRTIRFFIAWTYMMVLPFAFFQFPNDWLNIRHLYLVSVGFNVVIAAGAVYCSRLIAIHRWRRYVPLAVPVAFILLSRFIITQLDRSYELKAASRETTEMKEMLANGHGSVSIEDGTLVYTGGASAPERQ